MLVLVVLVMIAVCGVFGWRAGVVRRLVELVGFILSLFASARFAASVAPWLGEHTAMNTSTALFTSYVFVFAVGLVITWSVAAGVKKVVRHTVLGLVDQIGGAVCGVLLGALVISVGLIAVSQAPGGDDLRASLCKQPVGRVIYDAAPNIYIGARRLFGDKGEDLWQKFLTRGREAVDEAQQKAEEMKKDVPK